MIFAIVQTQHNGSFTRESDFLLSQWEFKKRFLRAKGIC